MKKIVLSHGDESDILAAIPALVARYSAGVVTVTVDIGQDGIGGGWRQRALDAGAIRAHVLEARDEFARDHVLRTLQACAPGDDAAAQGSALYRALLADKLVDIANMEGASIVAHGLEPQSDESVELERLILARRSDLVVVAARSAGADQSESTGGRPRRLPQATELLCVESTVWWRRAVLDVPGGSSIPRRIPGVRQGLFTVKAVEQCPPTGASIEIAFEQGVPANINGVEMSLVELIEAVDTIAGDHGVGRTVTEAAAYGTRRVTIVEAPASRVLASAYAALARAIESPSLWRLHRQLGKQYVKLLQSGSWHSDTRCAIDAFAGETRKRLSGAVRLELRRGRCAVVRKSVKTEPADTLDVASAQPLLDPPAAFTVPLPH